MEKTPSDNYSKGNYQGKPRRKNPFQEQRDAIDPVLKEQWLKQKLMISIQNTLAKKVKITDDPDFTLKSIKTVGAFDISSPKDDDTIGYACFVVMSFPDLKVLYKDSLLVTIDAPYCPGFLAFKQAFLTREVPHYITLYDKFKEKDTGIKVDVILVDGNGILHCNECGCASHLGVLLDVPTVGCGKTIFAVDGINKFVVNDIKEEFKSYDKGKGSFVLLKGKSGKIWGAGLKSGKDSNDPLIVSVGHRISIDTAINLVDICSKTRVPEPIRFVDKWSRKLIGDYEKSQKNQSLYKVKATPLKDEEKYSDDEED